MTPHPSTVTLMRNRTAVDTDDRQSGGTRARRHRLGLGGAAAAAVVFLVAGPASAHVDPDPLAVQAATAATIGFKVEHGCSGSPTNKLAVQIPATITDAKPVDKTGWTAALAGGVITFSGGKLDAATADHFDVTFTAPKDAGEAVFGIVQTCDKGQINWIEPMQDGKAEPEHPAAVLKITAGAPTVAELTPVDDTATNDAGTPASSTSSTSSSNKTPWVVGGIAAVVVLAGASTLLARNRRRTPLDR